MIRFNVTGRYIDLYNSLELQFTRKNGVFGFDELELIRSIAFDAPRTANNDAIFARAYDAALSGSQARVRIEAQMQYSGGANDGFLYITDASADGYTLCFVWGELLSLQAIKERGKIDAILHDVSAFSTYIDWSAGVNVRPANASEAVTYYTYFNPFYYLPYMDDIRGYWWQTTSIRPFPSYALAFVTDWCARTIGFTLQRNEQQSKYAQYRCVIPTFKDNNGAAIDIKDAMGKRFLLRHNLPDVTVVDLLKTEAALLGRQLTYSNGTISYEQPDFGNWPIYDVRRLLGIGSVQRTYGDYAQHNRYAYDNEAYVGNDAAGQDYTIDNVNIAADKELYKIPFNGGVSDTRPMYTDVSVQQPGVVVYDADVSYNAQGAAAFKAASKKHTIASCTASMTGSEVYMQRVRMYDNSALRRLLDASTKTTITVPMTLMEFNSLSERTLLNVRGTLFVWTEMQWGGDAATITLQKITL